MSTSSSHNGNARPSFKETFIAVGQQTLSKDRQDYVHSVGVLVTALMVLAGLLYLWTPAAAVVALVCALILLWGRWVIRRQVLQDMSQMHQARETVETQSPENAEEYRQFIRLRGAQMLRDNKALTPHAKQEIKALLQWAG
ncbi:hypothetical protein NQ015_03910 [Corynebacterium sp. 153RC1]|uniref:hypothetical protein n=1 Tax=unclassified Corynebacterium TaxID=2624378 RepID=UPI00211CFEBB|nr:MULTISPECIES: hypothetical protein [unclassified Corynebacterium]MCQ9369898.1 hypothetical protein [Corynebacterium sp. 35RC1]MCQ9352017.1 hypothetical protein [Corynebacterium sp. 209RC1]MCQ9353766.1 hypothetical protein [Corynebacterium sp. 1222RC1]MCQ9356250.1 hypothetical protein [Corynebacterium sp. 122RC1]MCQ9358352.1 hypothetical protein [Corynebacterium sp. 142RC1]